MNGQMLWKRFFLLLMSAKLCLGVGLAQSRSMLAAEREDPSRSFDATICSQNLFNHGTFKQARKRLKGLTQALLQEKRVALATRFKKVDCDIIAFQEALGKTGKDLEAGMNELVAVLQKRLGRRFEYILGDGTDRYMSLGFLYAEDKVKLEHYSSFGKLELPRLVPEQRPEYFSRAPLEATFSITDRKGGSRQITLVNIHFKSKSGQDPAALDWETTRMEMSEAVRRVILNKHKRAVVTGDPILIVLGDRNSHFDSASATILEGRLALKDFMRDAECRLSKSGIPLCKGKAARPQVLYSVLTRDPQVGQLEGTHKFKGHYSWLDDILMASSGLPWAYQDRIRPGDYNSGIQYEPALASDHALVWVKLNWAG